MRFAILRRFSHLIHRRTRSEPGVLPSHSIAPLDALTRSASLGNLATSTSSFFDTILPPQEAPLPPKLYSPDITARAGSPPLSPPPAFSIPLRPDSSPIPESLQLVAMQKQLEEMRVAYDNLKLDLDLRDTETKESDTGALKQFSSLGPDDQCTFVIRLHRKVVRFEKYFEMMHEVGLPRQLLSGAHEAISSGHDFEDVLVESIRNAALNPNSPWSAIVPAVIGPRAPEQYRAAIGNILRTRQEVLSAKKTAKFWKQTARALGAGLDIITPSPSNISDIHVALSPERAHAANELLSKLRSGEIPMRSQVVPHGMLPNRDSALSVSISSSGSSHSIVIRHASGTELPYARSSHSALAPLASQTFKEEFMASRSAGSGHRFSVSTVSSSRSGYARDSLELVRKGKSRQAAAEMPSQLVSDSSQQSDLGRKISSIIAPASRSFLDKLSQSWKPLEDGVFDATPDTIAGPSRTDSATRLRENFEKHSELACSDADISSGEDGVTRSSDDADVTMVESDSRMQKSRPSPAKKSMLPVPAKLTSNLSTTSFPIPPHSPTTPPSFSARPTISSTMKHGSSTPVKNTRVDIRPAASPTAPLRIRKKTTKPGEKPLRENKENVPPSMLVKGRTRLRRWSRLAT